MEAAMAYATLAELRALLGYESANVDDDALLTALLERAQATIEQRAGRRFEAVAATRYYDPTRDCLGQTLRLDADLLEPTLMRNGDGATISAGQYVLRPSNGPPYRQIVLKASSGLIWTYVDDPEDAISITGSWGYSASAPPDIVQATLRLAAYMYRQKDAQVYDVSAEPSAGVITVPQGIPRDVRLTLDSYRELL